MFNVGTDAVLISRNREVRVFANRYRSGPASRALQVPGCGSSLPCCMVRFFEATQRTELPATLPIYDLK